MNKTPLTKICPELNRKQLSSLFNDKISSTAIQKRDGGLLVIGKFAIITPMDDVLDVFICNSSDIPMGLGKRKINNIVSKLKKYTQEGSLMMLNGEAYLKVSDINAILFNLKLLGIRQKRKLSDQDKVSLTKRLAITRKLKNKGQPVINSSN